MKTRRKIMRGGQSDFEMGIACVARNLIRYTKDGGNWLIHYKGYKIGADNKLTNSGDSSAVYPFAIWIINHIIHNYDNRLPGDELFGKRFVYSGMAVEFLEHILNKMKSKLDKTLLDTTAEEGNIYTETLFNQKIDETLELIRVKKQSFIIEAKPEEQKAKSEKRSEESLSKATMLHLTKQTVNEEVKKIIEQYDKKLKVDEATLSKYSKDNAELNTKLILAQTEIERLNGKMKKSENLTNYYKEQINKIKPELVSEPLVSTNEPVVSTNEPVVSTNEPVVATNEPLVSTNEPVVSTNEPLVSTNEPLVSTNEPVVATNEPVVATNEPVVATNEPSVKTASGKKKSKKPQSIQPDIVPPPQADTKQLGQINSLHAFTQNQNKKYTQNMASIIQSAFKTKNKNWTQESFKAKFGDVKLDNLTFNFLANIYDNSNNIIKEQFMKSFFHFLSATPKVIGHEKTLLANSVVLDETQNIDFIKTIGKFISVHWIYQNKIEGKENEEEIEIYKTQSYDTGEALANGLLDCFDKDIDESDYVKQIIEISSTLNIKNRLGFLWFLLGFLEIIHERGKDKDYIEKIKSTDPLIYSFTKLFNEDKDIENLFLKSILDFKKAIKPLNIKEPLTETSLDYKNIIENIEFYRNNLFSDILENNIKIFLLINKKDSRFYKIFFDFINEISFVTKKLQNLESLIIDQKKNNKKDGPIQSLSYNFRIILDFINTIGFNYKKPSLSNNIIKKGADKLHSSVYESDNPGGGGYHPGGGGYSKGGRKRTKKQVKKMRKTRKKINKYQK